MRVCHRNLLLFCLWAILAPCLVRADSLTGYTRRIWLAPNEFPEQAAQAFAQTPDGYLWIGTMEGLLRFDGAHFTLFDNQNTAALHENNIFCLMTARDGSLWIGTEGGGLLHYERGHFHSWTTREGLSNDFVRVLREEADGSILVGTDNGLLRWRGGRFERMDGANGIPQLAVHAIYRDHAGSLWVGGSRLVRINAQGAHEFVFPGEASQNRVKSIVETRDGTLWVGTVSGLRRLNRDQQSFSPLPGITATVRILYPGSDGALWIGTIGQGAFRLSGNKLEQFTAPLEMPSNTILNFFEDAEHNLWIGAQTGLLRLTRSRVAIVALPHANDSDFGTVYADHDGAFWIGSTQLFHMREGQLGTENFPGLHGVHVRNLFRDRDGVLWAGTDGAGVLRIDGKSVTRLSMRDGLTNNFVRAMAQDRDGTMWVATDEGLNHIVRRNGALHIDPFMMRDGLVYFSTRSLLADRDGSLWIGTDRGLSHFRDGRFVDDVATMTLAQKKIWAIHQDERGTLWFGTRNNGLFRLEANHMAHFTTDDGLASNAIYQILEDHADHLWLSGPSGISLLKRSDLDRAAQSPQRRLALSFFSTAEMAPNTEIYGGTQPSGSISPRGEAWFPTSRGPVHLYPPSPNSQLPPPPLYLESVLRDGRALELDKPLALTPGTGRLELSFAPIRLRSQDGLRFRYQLEGLDQGWSLPTTNHTAEYTNLPAGHYRFRVQVFDTGSPEALSELSVEIVQRPFFYRTWWFLSLCALFVLLVVLAAYRYRVRQIRVRFEAVIEERSRLAREMHDTVIQGCTGVSALLEAASMSAPEGSASPLTEFARQQLRSTINEAREAIWNLRNSGEEAAELGNKLRAMAEHVAEEFKLPIEFNIEGEAFSLEAPVAHDLLMVSREAVYNAVLHGKPTQVSLKLIYAERSLSLEIIDNGTGFDPAAVAKRGGNHFGLKGMRERIARSGGKLELVTSPGEGTRITASMPDLR